MMWILSILGVLALCALLRGLPRPVRVPGTCRRCGYDLAGIDSEAACPECASTDRSRSGRRWTKARHGWLALGVVLSVTSGGLWFGHHALLAPGTAKGMPLPLLKLRLDLMPEDAETVDELLSRDDKEELGDRVLLGLAEGALEDESLSVGSERFRLVLRALGSELIDDDEMLVRIGRLVCEMTIEGPARLRAGEERKFTLFGGMRLPRGAVLDQTITFERLGVFEAGAPLRLAPHKETSSEHKIYGGGRSGPNTQLMFEVESRDADPSMASVACDVRVSFLAPGRDTHVTWTERPETSVEVVGPDEPSWVTFVSDDEVEQLVRDHIAIQALDVHNSPAHSENTYVSTNLSGTWAGVPLAHRIVLVLEDEEITLGRHGVDAAGGGYSSNDWLGRRLDLPELVTIRLDPDAAYAEALFGPGDEVFGGTITFENVPVVTRNSSAPDTSPTVIEYAPNTKPSSRPLRIER